MKAIIDISRLRSLFGDFSRTTGLTTGLISYPEQDLLFTTGGRRICAGFHYVCPRVYKSKIERTNRFKNPQGVCIHSDDIGLVDGVLPVFIERTRLASVVAGPVFFAPPDFAFHRQMARKCGHAEEAYLAALAKVPVMSEERLKSALKFLGGLAAQMAKDGLNRLRLQEAGEGVRAKNAQRKQPGQMLDRERLLLTSLKINIPDYVYVKDRDSRFIWMNDAKSRHLCPDDPEQIIGKTDYDFFAPEHADKAYADEQRIITTGRPIENLEEKEVWPDGRITWVSTTKVPMRDVEGKILGTIGITRDITLRKEMEQTLQKREEEARHVNDVLRAIRDIQKLIFSESDATMLLQGICEILIQTRGYLTAWVGAPQPDSNNVKLLAHAARKPETLNERAVIWDNNPTGQSPCQMVLRERVALILNDIESEPRLASWVQRAKDSGYNSIASFPIIYNEKLFGALTVKAGRTQAFTQEEIDILKGMVDEIAHALQSMDHATERRKVEEMLRQSQKLEAIGQLAGGIAHDFNNILGASMLQIGLLMDRPELTPELRSGLEDLEEGAFRASNLTRQLLMFSRKQSVKMKRLDIKVVLESVLGMLSRLLGETVLLDVQTDENQAWVKADNGMIEQVIVNLCINARDAMPNGGKLTLRVEKLEIEAGRAPVHIDIQPGGFICLSVADTGTGIAPEHFKHIFEPFFTTKEVGKGTGLGLATAHGIIQQHGGWIDVESKLGEGTIFRVYLPFFAAEQATPTKGKNNQFAKGSETILLVEDDAALLRSISRALRLLNYQVIEAVNGVDALAKWQESHEEIDLLLTDVVMPGGIAGLDLAQQIQSQRPGFEVIISSGYSNELNNFSPELYPGITLLPKPYDITALAKAIRRSLDQRNAR